MQRADVEGIAPAARAAGRGAAVIATGCSIAYVLAQLAEWAGLLGSAGGPGSTSTPLGLVVLLTPSLLLGPAFLVLAVAVHHAAPPDRRVWSHAGIAFATAYAVLICLVYFVQLTLVAPRLAAGRMEGIEVLRFVPFDSFLYAVDLLGYSFQCVATLFLARALAGAGAARRARAWLTANGLLLPFLVLQLYWHDLIWIAALWAITFPAATWSLAICFHRTPTVTPTA